MGDADEIHRTYRRLVKLWHPDQFAHHPAKQAIAEEKLKRINHAYSTLIEYFERSKTETRSAAPNTDSTKRDNPKTGATRTGFYQKWKGWLKETLSDKQIHRTTATPSGASHPPPHSTNRGNQSRFESVLRQAQAGNASKPLQRARRSRPMTPILRYRRRSGGTRIEGTRPVSPVNPIRPISAISPIEGSD